MYDVCVLYFTLTCVSYTLCTIGTHTESLKYYFQNILHIRVLSFLAHASPWILLQFLKKGFFVFCCLLSSNKFSLE